MEKERLLNLINELDLRVETNPLGVADSAAKREAEEKLAKLLREEEIKLALKANVRQVVQGDNNTQYFHLIANEKHRKKKIVQLEQDEGTIIGRENLKLYISNFYKKLFGPLIENFVSLDEGAMGDIPQLGMDANELLNAPFTEKEVFEAIMQMKYNMAPGPGWVSGGILSEVLGDN